MCIVWGLRIKKGELRWTHSCAVSLKTRRVVFFVDVGLGLDEIDHMFVPPNLPMVPTMEPRPHAAAVTLTLTREHLSTLFRVFDSSTLLLRWMQTRANWWFVKLFEKIQPLR